MQKMRLKEEKKRGEGSDDEARSASAGGLEPLASLTRPTADALNQPPPREAIEMATQIKDRLLAQIEVLGNSLPPNTLDQLIDELGGPENVAEMTGRKGRVVQNDNGQVQYESRSETDVPLEILNVREKERFMAGEKDVAIISEAASSGISLQVRRILSFDLGNGLVSGFFSHVNAKCRRIAVSRTSGVGFTSPWNCRGVPIEPFSNSAARIAVTRYGAFFNSFV